MVALWTRGKEAGVVCVLLGALLALMAFAPAASADLIIGSPGPGAGQYEKPKSVAVDTSTGHVYVADEENNRVDVFDESGAFLFAFGWKVNAEHPEEKLQTCTPVTGCQKGTPGSGAGQFDSSNSSPLNIAVDSASHDVYVADGENNRVEKFDAAGNFLLAFGKGVNSGTSGNADVCTVAGPPTNVCRAGTRGNSPGQIAAPFGGSRVGIGPGGTVYVLGAVNRLQKFEPSGAFLVELSPLPPGGLGQNVHGFAVDSVGDFYTASDGETGAVRKYDAAGNLLSTINPSFNIQAIAVDPADDLFISDTRSTGQTQIFPTRIFEYNPSGIKNRVFFGSGTLEEKPISLTFHHTATGDLYAVEAGPNEVAIGTPNPARVVQLALPEPGPLLVPGSAEASPLGNVRATLRVEFNSENKASKAHFQYITRAAYEANLAELKEGFVGADETPDSVPTPADFENHTAAVTNTCSSEHPLEATCLKPETAYYFRAIASNADGTVTGEKVEFTTLPPLQIDATWATEVGTDTARVNAEVNPLTIHATAHFEYVDDATFQADQPNGFEHAKITGTLDFGSGEAPLARAAQLAGLQPDTIYHYRLVASDPFFLAVTSAAHVFTTFASPVVGAEQCPGNAAFRTGPSAGLPDCRAYELVTPLNKNNGDVLTRSNVTGFPTALDQSSTAGSGFTYSSYRAFADPQSAPYTDQFLAVRHERGQAEEGWSATAINPPRSTQSPLGPAASLENEYDAFSSDLSSAWLLRETEPTLAPCAAAGFADLYRRDSADGAFAPLSCAEPHQGNGVFSPELEGFSADGSHAVFRVDDALTVSEGSPPASSATVDESGIRPIYQLYESIGVAQLHLVSVLPSGEASAEDSSVGTAHNNNVVVNHNRYQSVLGAVSADGTRAFWSTGGSVGGQIYLRFNADQEQSKIKLGKCSQPTRACTIPVSATVTPEGALFQAANPQGTKALFTVTQGPLKGNLYRFDAEAEPPSSQLIAKKVQFTVGPQVSSANILGASEDLSRVYFASEEATPSQQLEGALEGQPNLYLYDEGATRFIGMLSAADLSNPYGTPAQVAPVIERTARVSPDGQSLVFMSNSLALSEATAEYDNTDALSGEADAEVYLYDATANSGTGTLRCVSCNPSGARPSGRELQGFNGNNVGTNSWAAAAVPHFETQLYQPRYLSDDGHRVFFDSYDALVLGDTNGKEDAYQWEQAGTGGCKSDSPSYVPASAGCLSLLSSGQSPSDSEFLDASSTGKDAFFTTVEGLLPQDPGLVDVYDARVEGGFPPPPNLTPSCEGEACQGPPEPPNDPTPASSSGEFAGNVKEEKPKPHCAKGKVRRSGKCLSKHKRIKHHHNRHANRNGGAAR
jgi:DNA-binding beta-propeller fold protein YncE